MERRGARAAAAGPARRQRVDELQPGRHLAPREPRKVDGQDVDYAKGPYAGAHAPGERVADGIVRAWRDAGDRMQPTLDVDARRAFLDFDGTAADGEPVGPVPVLGAAGVTGPDGFCAPVDNLAGPGQGGKFPMLAGRGLLPSTVPVSVWRLGSLGVAAFPSEITKTMGGRIRSAIQNEAGGALPAGRDRRPDERVRLLHGDTRGVRRLPLRGLVHAVRPPPGRALARLRARPDAVAHHRRARARRAPPSRRTPALRSPTVSSRPSRRPTPAPSWKSRRRA